MNIELAHEATHAHRNAPPRAQNARDPHDMVTRVVFQNRHECAIHAANLRPLIAPSRVRWVIAVRVVIHVLVRATETIKGISFTCA